MRFFRYCLQPPKKIFGKTFTSTVQEVTDEEAVELNATPGFAEVHRSSSTFTEPASVVYAPAPIRGETPDTVYAPRELLPESLADLRLGELRELARKNGLDPVGGKSVLIARLTHGDTD